MHLLGRGGGDGWRQRNHQVREVRVDAPSAGWDLKRLARAQGEPAGPKSLAGGSQVATPQRLPRRGTQPHGGERRRSLEKNGTCNPSCLHWSLLHPFILGPNASCTRRVGGRGGGDPPQSGRGR